MHKCITEAFADVDSMLGRAMAAGAVAVEDGGVLVGSGATLVGSLLIVINGDSRLPQKLDPEQAFEFGILRVES